MLSFKRDKWEETIFKHKSWYMYICNLALVDSTVNINTFITGNSEESNH